jgi:hypothetical protein
MNFNNFGVCVVIEFDPKCSSNVKDWINAKLSVVEEKNGPELKTEFARNSKNEVGIILYF